MKTYVVGGSVRDKILGRQSRDKDYLVVGASEEELFRRGLVRVGQSFPVYIDPKTQEEYTLSASVEADLARRDLTINAMAMSEEGILIDPFGGMNDISKKVLRQVRRENFFEDPLRVLRVARFLTELPGFQIAPETKELMREVVRTDAYKTLIGERLIKELKKVFESDRPSVFFRTLEEVNGLHELFPGTSFDELDSGPGIEEVRFALLFSSLETLSLWQKRMVFPVTWIETARAWILFKDWKKTGEKFTLLDFFYAIDAFRKPFLIEKIALISPGDRRLLEACFQCVNEVGIREVSPELRGKEISEAIRQERLKRILLA